jgi:carboxylate-amine ligase
VPPEVLQAAHWRAARDGVGGALVDPVTGRPAPARDVLTRLVEHVRPALEAERDAAFVDAAVIDLLRRGSGATRQRAVFERSGRVADVIRLLAEETAAPD